MGKIYLTDESFTADNQHFCLDRFRGKNFLISKLSLVLLNILGKSIFCPWSPWHMYLSCGISYGKVMWIKIQIELAHGMAFSEFDGLSFEYWSLLGWYLKYGRYSTRKSKIVFKDMYIVHIEMTPACFWIVLLFFKILF